MENLEIFLSQYWNTIPLLIAFAGGIIAFLSPCTLPLLPVYLSYISGVGIADTKDMTTKTRLKVFLNTLFFVIGFSIIFIALAVLVSYFGNFARKILYNDMLYKILGVLVIIMGIQLTGVFKFKFLSGEKKININFNKKGYLFSMFLGMAFAIGWSPCTGPILGTLLAMAATASTVWVGILYLSAFSLGLGLPFLIISFFMDYFTQIIKKSGKVVSIISVISGVILIVMGFVLFFNKLGVISGIFY